MIKVYGIKTCGSVRNALKFFKDHNIEIDFVDFKTIKIDLETDNLTKENRLLI